MSKRTKKFEDLIDEKEVFTLQDALEVLKKAPETKFDQTIDLSLKLGIDPKKSDQQVRGTVSLPHGTGRKIRVLVFARGDKVKEALDAGADYAGHDELVEKVKGGWTDFDAVVAAPDMMREVGKLGKILGPRGLMPSPKAGTVTDDVSKAVEEVKAGKIEFKADKQGVINLGVGKRSFAIDQLLENIKSVISSINRAKPVSAKGQYMKGLYLSSTMGPGLKIDMQTISS